ncbi:MAG TPA: BatD family protein [Candidatus Ozemobacteraceae bacterium]|nr:BatD family protein [Candidatus Ozemobacteraceae bacterium]
MPKTCHLIHEAGMRLRDSHLRHVALLVMLVSLLAVVPGVALDASLDAEVDRTTVRFGESLTLTLTLSQALGGGGGRQIITPNVDSIPDFDIAGRRTAQNMSFINGVGQVQVQTSLELVPRGPGEFTIPAMGFKLPDGRSVSSKAIKVKVLPPEDESAAGQGSTQPAAPEEDDASRVANGGGMSLFKAFSMLLLITAAVICLPILLSWYMSGRAASSRTRVSPATDEGAPNTSETGAVEDAKIVSVATPSAEKVDFEREVERLKIEYKEPTLEFYRVYFDIFHKALVAANPRMKPEQTPDELRRTAEEHFPPAVSSRMKPVVDEWEGVTYARMLPSRPFSALHDDARTIVRSLIHRQETHR